MNAMLRRLLTATLLLGAAHAAFAAGAATFATPEQAADALVAAVRDASTMKLIALFGPQSEAVVDAIDASADDRQRENFLSQYGLKHTLTGEGDTRTLTIGEDDWPFPVPLRHVAAGWHFDGPAGHREIVARLIGRDEIDAQRVSEAIAEAQQEYASVYHGDQALRSYAARLFSTPGRQDGLYWPAPLGQPESPLGPMLAEAEANGYRASEGGAAQTPYKGYFYRILTAAGPHAPGGATDWMVHGQLVGGFAVLAYPAQYGLTGVMTFMTGYDGTLYQRDLGPDTARAALAIRQFDPGPGWRRVQTAP